MPVVQDREAKEATLKAALAAAWAEWTAVADPANLSTRDLDAILRKYAYQPLWELYYTAQYVVAKELNQQITEQAIAAAFVLYYMTWASDVAQRWMSRVSTWLLETRMAAHSRQRDSQPTPPSTGSQAAAGPTAPKPAMTPSTATQGGAPVTTPTRTDLPQPPPTVVEVPGSREPTSKPQSISDEVADRWKKEKQTVVDPEAYSRDAVTSTNSAGELAVVDSVGRTGRRIEAIWVLDPNSNWCERCYALDGTTRDVWSQVAPNGPQLHPHCACSLRYIEVDDAGKPIDYTPMRDQPF